jgi:hypothetical protein
MKTFLIQQSTNPDLVRKSFRIQTTAIKTMHSLPEISDGEMRVNMFDGRKLIISNGDLKIEAMLLSSN